jgi:hypothetical protein
MNRFQIEESDGYKNGKITVYDDGKEKHNSHEARLYIESCVSRGSIQIELQVFESSREESLKELKIAFNELLEQFKIDWNLD